MRTAALCLLLSCLPLMAGARGGPADGPSDWSPALLRAAGVDPGKIRCNRDNRWGATLRQDAKDGAAEMMALLTPSLAPLSEQARTELSRKLTGLLFWRMVRAVLLEADTNNVGAFPLKGRTYVDDSGRRRQVLVFRSGYTPRPEAEDSCFRSLLGEGRVRHVVNLFDGDIPVSDLNAAESRAAAQAGASYSIATDDPGGYGPWRELLRSHYDEPDKRRQAMEAVARLIREQIVAPQGAPPRGNLHLHCGGGMHRTGMIAGVLERCVNGTPLPVVEANYRYHVGYRDAAHPGGLEEGNLRFIRDFDCALLQSGGTATTESGPRR